MSKPKTILERLESLYCEVFNNGKPFKLEPTDTERWMELDSLERLEFLMEIEDEFDLYIADHEAEAWKCVGDIVAFLQKKGVK